MLTPKVVWLVVEYERECGIVPSTGEYECNTINLAVFDSKARAIAWVEANAPTGGGSWHPHGFLEYRQDSWLSWSIEEMDFNPGGTPC